MVRKTARVYGRCHEDGKADIDCNLLVEEDRWVWQLDRNQKACNASGGHSFKPKAGKCIVPKLSEGAGCVSRVRKPTSHPYVIIC